MLIGIVKGKKEFSAENSGFIIKELIGIVNES